MKNIGFTVVIIAACSTLFALSGCKKRCIRGSGNQVTENRKMGDFNKIDITDGFKIVLKQDSSLSIAVTADDNLMKYIKTTVSGEKLSISTGTSRLCGSGSINIVIGVHKLEGISASGAVEMNSDGKIVTQDLSLGLSGVEKINLDLSAANLTTTVSGLADLNLRGQATSNDLKITGTGKINALDFITGSTSINISGLGHCQVNVLNTLTVHSSGLADVKYKGNPKVNNDNSGASSVKKID